MQDNLELKKIVDKFNTHFDCEVQRHFGFSLEEQEAIYNIYNSMFIEINEQNIAYIYEKNRIAKIIKSNCVQFIYNNKGKLSNNEEYLLFSDRSKELLLFHLKYRLPFNVEEIVNKNTTLQASFFFLHKKEIENINQLKKDLCSINFFKKPV